MPLKLLQPFERAGDGKKHSIVQRYTASWSGNAVLPRRKQKQERVLDRSRMSRCPKSIAPWNLDCLERCNAEAHPARHNARGSQPESAAAECMHRPAQVSDLSPEWSKVECGSVEFHARVPLIKQRKSVLSKPDYRTLDKRDLLSTHACDQCAQSEWTGGPKCVSSARRAFAFAC